MDELYVELGQYKARDWFSSSDSSIIKIDETPAGSCSFTTDHISSPFIAVVEGDRRTEIDHSPSSTIIVSNSFKSDESEDIVQIPLDESDVQTEVLQGMEDKVNVPLSDAPLIGAPFRLISLFASYVSGADLVDKK